MRIPKRRSRAGCVIGVFGALLALAPGGWAAPAKAKAPASPPPQTRPQTFPTPNYVQEKYDGVLSVNDHCPVRHGKLHPGIRPTYVNLQPVGFC